MDLDAYELARSGQWRRLDELAGRRRRTGAEADELVRLYQSGATDLSVIRSTAPDPLTISRLSQLLARSRAAIAGTHDASWRDVARFVTVLLPAALYRVRWWVWGVTAVFLALAVVAGIHVATSPAALAAMGPPSYRQDYVNHAFESYYDPGVGFAATVWTHNALITAVAVGTGITGILPVAALAENAVNVGAAGGLMASYGHLSLFLQLIAPHGLLELTSVFVAGGAGLKVFWTWIDPGPRPRGRALAEEARALFTVAIGLAGTLLVSGCIEGFVTGSHLPWAVKVGIGVVAVSAFWVYVLVLGGRASRDGRSGDLEADRAGYEVATAG